jgi:ADP-heptose:LPS heptosyltransferase
VPLEGFSWKPGVNSPVPARQFERILLVKPSAFGDVLHTLPVLVKLRARFPAARIDWLITPENAELVRYHPAISNVVLFPRRDLARLSHGWSAASSLLHLFGEIRRGRYDLVIDLHGQMRSALFTLATGAPVRIGFDRPQRHLLHASRTSASRHVGLHGWHGAREGSWLAYTHRIPIPTLDVHAVDRYLWIGAMLGMDDGSLDLRVYWPEQADQRVDDLLREAGLPQKGFAILVPTTIWETKHWPAHRFAAVGRYLLEQGIPVIVGGAPGDEKRCRAVVDACPGARDLSGRTSLSEFAALMNRSTVNVTNDSGSMHLAAALGRPVVSVFGPTDPVWTGPYGRAESVVRAALPCSPCYLKKLSACPFGHACMNEVTPQMVIDRVRQMLGQRQSSAA